jgi:CheY-like chemotaxis protein
VNNLVNNAIKYSPPGTEVEVHLKESEGRALLSIKDSGIGISRQHLSRIFERFEQGDSSTRRSFGGLGLGLTIARHLTELHGGTIEVESEGEGLGAVFTVSLPLNRNVVRQYFSKRKPGSDSEAESNLLRKTRILIVEDDVDSLEMLRLVLENSGAEVTPVDRSQKAVDELSRNSFDLIISDLGLPGMDGYDLIQEVRGGLGIDPKRLPAIALSGYVAEDDRHRSLSNGFQMHLQKPLDVSTLASTVKALLDELKRNN